MRDNERSVRENHDDGCRRVQRVAQHLPRGQGGCKEGEHGDHLNDEQPLAFEERADRVDLGRFLRMNVFHDDLNDSFPL